MKRGGRLKRCRLKPRPKRPVRSLPAHRLMIGESSAERDPAYRAWISTHECVVPGCERPSECCHFHNRRDGGDIGNCWPGCHPHHMEQHRGIKTFQKKYGLDLAQIAAGYGEAWAQRTPELVGFP